MKHIILFLLFVPLFLKAQVSELQRRYVEPIRIVKSQFIENQEQLVEKGIHQAKLSGGNFAKMVPNKYGETYIIFDFGKELQGGIQLVTGGFQGKETIKVRMRFGESVSEVCSNVGESGATNDHSVRDFEVDLPWMGGVDYGATGFRFVRIDLLEQERTLLLQEVSAIAEQRNIPYLGSFECSDDRLNEIWNVGAYTVHLNMQEYLWDGVKRDRLVWVGDMHPEVMTIGAVFGYNEVVPKSLDYIRDATSNSAWMNNISSYSMWWLLIHYDWFMMNGDKEYLENQKEYATALIEKLLTKIDKQGVEQLDGHRFLDWPTSGDQNTIKLGYQALLAQTLSVWAYLFDTMEEEELVKRCLDAVELLEKAEGLPKATTKQAIALLCLNDMIDEEKAQSKLLHGGASHFSTFYGYYMLEALAKVEKQKEAIEIIRDFWGGMLDLGATTFWEDFNISWLENASRIDELPSKDKVDVHRSYGDHCYTGLRHSFCHGWASGPTPWLTKHVLGVNIVEPGCSKIVLQPNLGDLEWVKGRFPTPKGVVEIEHIKLKNGKIKTTFDAPRGVKVQVK